MKGSAVLSENMLTIFSIIISFILMVLVVRLVLTQQSERTQRNMFESIGREIALIIDRAAGTAGSEKIEYELPKGVHANITIDYKYVFVIYGKNIVKKPYSGNIISDVNFFEEPRILCFEKIEQDLEVHELSCDEVS